MSKVKCLTIDGNEAVASVAYRLNEVCCIYPITPSSPMGESADLWASEGKLNIWGNIPTIYEMQSEGGAAGAVHGALQAGSLTTTFTASQGLLLMIPNMYKIAGELSPAVLHVAARSLAAQGLSIFGDHSDVMAVRNTGFAMLCSNSPQQAHDMALIAQASTLESRIPFIHFFDGFRTSHEVNKVAMLTDDDLRSMISDELLISHRKRGLSPDHPFMRGTAQNPDVYFQGRETVNPFYSAAPDIVQKHMDNFATLTGREYRLFQYYGNENAERIIILMGSGAETTRETIDALLGEGEKVGVVQVHLFRPFSIKHFVKSIPSTVKRIAVLDRTKEPGATGEPLYLEVVNALVEAQVDGTCPLKTMPQIIGGRYGLSSREFTPAMVKAVFDELKKDKPKNHFTVGIDDDVAHTSLKFHASYITESSDEFKAVFYGLGADGTVGANKNTIKIIGEDPSFYAQGYFVYDSKKSGSQTVSHLRFGPKPIRSTYLVQQANFVACHHFDFVKKMPVLERAAHGSVFLLNSHYDENTVWQKLPGSLQKEIIDKEIVFYVIDATKVARQVGLGSRTNTIMQTCFFAISGVLPREQAIEKIKSTIKKTYGKKGGNVVDMNFRAVETALQNLAQVAYPESPSNAQGLVNPVSQRAPEFVRSVTAKMLAGRGELIPVSQLPEDGTFPTATSKWEKRNIATSIPIWEPDICVQCGNCSVVCPHSVIRTRFFHEDYLEGAPPGFKSAPIDARGFPEVQYSLQIYAEDCTACGLCVEVCPAKSLTRSGVKAINMHDKGDLIAQSKINIEFFESIPLQQRRDVNFSTVKGVQFLEPLFEFSGACAGCGETPYLKLASQLFGDRMMVANATGCSSIYGGNLPTTPWSKNSDGRGPAWSNSLFEDNAEFGLGFRLSTDSHKAMCEMLLRELWEPLTSLMDENTLHELLVSKQITESQIDAQRKRVEQLKSVLPQLDSEKAKHVESLADYLVRKSIWIVGGDGWAYDIGSSGLDHVLASGRDVNILVLDTEVYSNTGGQMSKATPLAAVAKFASKGKSVGKKDLALQAMAYGNVYVARVAMGANPQQTLMAMREAEAFPGTSIILAYSHCIAHGIDMKKGLHQQSLAVKSGYWPLMRFNPAVRMHDEEVNSNPFILDSQRPDIPFRDYAYNELRYKMLTRTHPREAEALMTLAEKNVMHRWSIYEEMATRNPNNFEKAPIGFNSD